jgi:hypothetical protein
MKPGPTKKFSGEEKEAHWLYITEKRGNIAEIEI